MGLTPPLRLCQGSTPRHPKLWLFLGDINKQIQGLKRNSVTIKFVIFSLQAEECALRACVDRFNSRRYNNASFHPDLEPVDSCVTSVLGKPLELTDEFKQHYEVWLEQEVMKMNVNWDLLLCKGYMG